MANGKRKEFNIVDELKKDGIGPTSWKDLTGKPFGKETEMVEFIPEQTITGTPDSGAHMTSWILPFDVTNLSTPEDVQNFLNSEKIITVDGTEYRGKLTLDSSGAFVDADGEVIVFRANLPPNYDGGNEYVELTMAYESSFGWGLLAWGYQYDDWNIVVSVTGEVTTITPIPTEYLPEALQFGREVVDADLITWDGTPTDVSVNLNGTNLYRISDKVFTEDSLTDTTMVLSNGEIVTPTVGILPTTTAVQVASGSYVVLVIPEDNYTLSLMEVTFPKAGCYWVNMSGDGVYLTALHKSGAVVTLLDSDLVPPSSAVLFVTVRPTGDGTLTADKTHAEILNAAQKGKACIAILYSSSGWLSGLYTLNRVAPEREDTEFVNFSVSGNELLVGNIRISPSGECSDSYYTVALTPYA